jgi:hypothetical protein
MFWVLFSFLLGVSDVRCAPHLLLEDHRLGIASAATKSYSWDDTDAACCDYGGEYKSISIFHGVVTLQGNWHDSIDDSLWNVYISQKINGSVDIMISHDGSPMHKICTNFEEAYRLPLFRHLIDEQFLSITGDKDFFEERFDRFVNDPLWKPPNGMAAKFNLLLGQLNSPDWRVRTRSQHNIRELGLNGAALIVRLDGRKLSAEQRARLDDILIQLKELPS